MIDRIVVPLDGSERAATALGPARAIAERTGASVLLLRTVWGEDPDEVQRDLDAGAATLGATPADTKIVRGEFVARAILAEATTDAVVCMTTHGRSGVGHALLGSVAEAVIAGSNRPLLLVGPSIEPGAWEFEHWFAGGDAMVTVDGSEPSEAVLPAAAEWSRLLGLRVWLVQVLEEGAGVAGAEPGAEVAAVRRAADLIRATGTDAHWDVLRGEPVADLLVDYAERLPASLIALATHGRTGLARVTLGSVAMKVVHRSPCPVLVIRPERLGG
jgi:nucleotide-binding universal stress UspA family protein